MSAIPSPDWRHVGKTSNSDFYELAPDVLVIVPHPDSADDERTARESLAFQRAHWAKVGRRGAVIVWMDPVLQQDSGARAVYTNETVGHPSTCFALIGQSFFAQASAAVFTGLAKPGIPTQVFPSIGAARPWIEEQNKAHGGRV